MALKRIKFLENGSSEVGKGIHFEHWAMDYTLCGVTLDGDPLTAGNWEQIGRNNRRKMDAQ